MGSYALLRVGDIQIAQFKSQIEDWVALLFTADDWTTRHASVTHLDMHAADAEVYELAAPVGVIRDRLELLGTSWRAVEEAFDEALAVKTSSYRGLIDEGIDHDDLDAELDFLERLTLSDWIRLLADAPPDAAPMTKAVIGSRSWLLELWDGYDVHVYLHAVLASRSDDEFVVLDVTDLIDGGWLDPSEDPRSRALMQFACPRCREPGHRAHGGLYRRPDP